MSKDDQPARDAFAGDRRHPSRMRSLSAQSFPPDDMDETFVSSGFPLDEDEREFALHAHDDLVGEEHTPVFDAGHLDDADSEIAAKTEASESYWVLSRAPLESLVFTLPLVLVYEVGVLFCGRGMPRNGADVWLRGILDSLGFGAYFFLLPALTVMGLAAWHHLEHDRWVFRARVLVGMVCESLVLACVLIGLAHLHEDYWPERLPQESIAVVLDAGSAGAGPPHASSAELSSVVSRNTLMLQRLVGYCGAGLYEEVLFRLLMLPVLAWMLARLGMSHSTALGGGVLLSAVLFSAAHYVGLHGESFELYSFTFRTVAGVFFGILFLLRGFGISAGTHAMYDVLVGLV